MNYIRIDNFNLVNGPGIRVVLWVAGCEHFCRGCHNPETWSFDGKKFSQETIDEIISKMDNDYTAGITITGGDPLHPRNREDVLFLCKTLKEKFKNSKNIWIYSGYTYEELLNDGVDLSNVDILVDGEFKEELKIPNLKLRGSTNQRFINIQASLAAKKAIEISF